MKPKDMALCVLLSAAALMSNVCRGQSDDPEDEPNIIDIPRGNDLVDDFMVPLYAMARGFLTNAVQHEDLRFMEERGVDFGDWDSVTDHDYEDWLEYFVGYLAWSGVGIVLMVVLLIAGFVLLCCCCCSCCGMCCSNKQREEDKMRRDKNSNCCRITLAVVLLLLTTSMIPPLAFMIVSGVRLREQMNSDDNVFDTAREGITTLDAYAWQTSTEMETVIIGEVEIMSNRSLEEFDLLFVRIMEDFDIEIGAEDALEDLNALNQTLIESEDVSSTGLGTANDLDADYGQLDTALVQIRNLIGVSLAGCTSAECTDFMENEINKLVPGATYDPSVAELGDYNVFITGFNDNGEFSNEVNIANLEYENVLTSIENDINNITDTANEEFDKAIVEMENYVDDVNEKINEFDFDSALEEIDSIEDDASTPADILFYSVIGICCLIAFVLIWNYVGILVGLCCPADPNSTCNSSLGSGILKLGVGFTFVIQWFLMIILITSFLVSGIFYTEVCRHMVAYNESEVVDIMDDLIDGTILDSVDVNITTSEIYTNCGNDVAFYTAFGLEENALNITDIVYDERLDEEVDAFREYEIIFDPDVVLLSAEMMLLLELIDDNFDAVDFETMYDDLEQDVVATSVNDYIANLESLLDQDVDQDGINDAITALEELNNTLIADMETEKTVLLDEVRSLDELLNVTINVLVDDLSTAETNLANDTLTHNILDGNRNMTVENVEVIIEETRQEIIYQVETNVGRCFDVFYVIVSVTDEVCVKTLYPIHGFWFSLGWCYVVLAICIIISLILASEFRKIYSPLESPAGHKSTDYMMHPATNRSTLYDNQQLTDLDQNRNSMRPYDNPLVDDNMDDIDLHGTSGYMNNNFEPEPQGRFEIARPVMASVPLASTSSSSRSSLYPSLPEKQENFEESPYDKPFYRPVGEERLPATTNRNTIATEAPVPMIPRLNQPQSPYGRASLQVIPDDAEDMDDWRKKREQQLKGMNDMYSEVNLGYEPDTRVQRPRTQQPVGGVRVLPPVSIT